MAAIDSLDNLIREELPSMIIEIGPEIAPVFDKIKRTAIGVKSQEGLGQGWDVIHLYETGVAGLMESGDPAGPGMQSIVTNQVQMLAQGSAATNLSIFPTAAESPHIGDIKRTLTLHKVVGNFNIPVIWKQAEMLNAAQIKKVSRDMKAVAKLKAIYEATSFFSHSVTNDASKVNQVLGRVSATTAPSDNATTTGYIDVAINETYGRIANFRKGMKIDMVADSSGTLQSGVGVDGSDVRNYDASTEYVHLVIQDVDFLGKTITLCPIDSVDGTLPAWANGWVGSTAFQGAVNDWLVWAKSTRYYAASRPPFTWGINDWVKSSGTILGGAAAAAALDLDVYSQFKSQVIDVSGPLTDDVINGYIGGYLDAYPGESLDTIITTQGVQLKWLQQPGLYNNRQNYERTGKALSFKGGWSQIGYEFGGRTYEFIMSPMCLSNTLYALKFAGDNIRRYGPPRIGGSNDLMGPELEFLAPLSGHTGVFMGVTSSTGAPQDLLQCPFWYYNLIAPTDPRGVKLTNLTEATML